MKILQIKYTFNHIKIYFFGIQIFSIKRFFTTKKFKKLYANRFNNLSQNDIKFLLKQQFLQMTSKQLNIDNPQTFNEKIQWYKLYYKNPLMTKVADKIQLRDYVKQIIGKQYLIKSLGIYNTPEEIDFNNLPNQFVIKVNWGSGQNIIVKNKKQLDIPQTIAQLEQWIKPESNHYYDFFEWCYKDMKPQIIIEEYIQQLNNDLYDYKFLCYNGKVNKLFVVSDRFKNKYLDFYDNDWNHLPFERLYHNSPKGITKPQNLKEMISIAEKLSKPFPFVRVDLYSIQNQIYIGELTFYPGNGVELFSPEKWDYTLGQDFTLPQKSK